MEINVKKRLEIQNKLRLLQKRFGNTFNNNLVTTMNLKRVFFKAVLISQDLLGFSFQSFNLKFKPVRCKLHLWM